MVNGALGDEDEDEDEWGESTGELSKNGPGVMRPLYCQP